MNTYVFHKASKTAIRSIWIESNDDGYKSVVDIFEMQFDGSKESLKRTVKCLYEMMFVGERQEDKTKGYELKTEGEEYDESLAGKARKQSSKEINVITEQLWSFVI